MNRGLFDGCPECSGLKAEIEALKQDRIEQWKIINQIRNRITISIGGIAVSCVLLVVDILLRGIGK